VWSVLSLLRSDPERLREVVRLRREDPELVDRALSLDTEWRRLKAQVDEKRAERNRLNRRVARAPPEEKRRLIQALREISSELEALEARFSEVSREREEALRALPNTLHPDVPTGCPEGVDGVPVRFWGRPRVWEGHLESFKRETEAWGFRVDYELIDWRPAGHADEMEKVLRLSDTLRAARVAGSRFFYLYEDLVWLDLALTMYAVDQMTRKGFILVNPPYMLRGGYYHGVAPLQDFADAIYKLEDEDLYLIATSEHPLVVQHAGEELQPAHLPLLYVGVSPCFRREAGAGHSRDVKGIFRVHQFHKVEQVVICMPEESWEWHERLIRNAEELWQGLGIPYRIVDICAHDLGAQAARKYDLEAWMPAQGRYREMVSCSNCTDWQSYRLGIRFIRGDGTRGYVHTLNSTAIATTRAMTAIVENFQEPDGTVVIPKVLRPYLEMFERAPKEVIEPKRLPGRY